MPVGRLNGESPIILEIEGVSVTAAVDAMALDTLLIDDQLSALFEAFLACGNRLNESSCKIVEVSALSSNLRSFTSCVVTNDRTCKRCSSVRIPSHDGMADPGRPWVTVSNKSF